MLHFFGIISNIVHNIPTLALANNLEAKNALGPLHKLILLFMTIFYKKKKGRTTLHVQYTQE